MCLFTCLSSRAVHLELLRSLTVESFLLAFWQFARLLATLISDNAKTFNGSSKEVQKIAWSKEVVPSVKQQSIMEVHSWKGSLVGWILGAPDTECEKMFKKVHWKNPELWGVADAIDWSRDVEDDYDGVTYALSPSHLIHGRHITSTPNGGHFEVVSTNASLTRRAKHHRHLLH